MNDPHDHEAHRNRRRQANRAMAKAVHKLAQDYHAAFSSDAGRRVLADLERCYDGSTTGHSPRKTELHSVQRDVFMRIRDLIEIAQENPDELELNQTIVENLKDPWSRYET